MPMPWVTIAVPLVSAVDAHLERVAQGAVAGIGLGDEVGNVDRSLFARCDLARGGHNVSSPLDSSGRSSSRMVLLRGVCIADGGLYLLPGWMWEKALRVGEPQPSAGTTGRAPRWYFMRG